MFAIVELYSEAGVVITLSTVGNITHWGLCRTKKRLKNRGLSETETVPNPPLAEEKSRNISLYYIDISIRTYYFFDTHNSSIFLCIIWKTIYFYSVFFLRFRLCFSRFPQDPPPMEVAGGSKCDKQ